MLGGEAPLEEAWCWAQAWDLLLGSYTHWLIFLRQVSNGFLLPIFHAYVILGCLDAFIVLFINALLV